MRFFFRLALCKSLSAAVASPAVAIQLQESGAELQLGGLSRSVSAAYRPRAATRDEFECLPLDGPSPCLTPPNAKHEFFHFDDFFTDWKYSSNSDSS